MSDISNMLSKIIVIKRDGKKAEFDTAKVVVAIKKGFDSVQTENANIEKYTEKDIYKIYNNVAKKIVDSKKDRIKIDEIQDYIEEALKEDGYEDVCFQIIEKEEINQESYFLMKKNSMLF